MNFKLSVLLVVAASGCVETPAPTRLPSSRDVSLDAVQLKDQPARYAVDVDSLIPCPLDAVMQMLPDPMVQQHLTHAYRTHGGATSVSGMMKPIGKSFYVNFSIGLRGMYPPVLGVYPLGKIAGLHLAVERRCGYHNYTRIFDLDLTATQGTLELTRVEGRVQGVIMNAVLAEGRRDPRDTNDACPSILVPELRFDATWSN